MQLIEAEKLMPGDKLRWHHASGDIECEFVKMTDTQAVAVRSFNSQKGTSNHEVPHQWLQLIQKAETTNQAMRFNTGKPQWSLVDMTCFEDMVRVLEFGAKKYTPGNWKKGLPIMSQYDSLARHMVAFMNGENTDPETGLSHLAHAQCNLMFMMHTMKHHSNLDNREMNDGKPKNE